MPITTTASQALVITSIAPVTRILRQWATECQQHNTAFILIGDETSPRNFTLKNCDFYDLKKQSVLPFHLAKHLPTKSYTRKNLGYLLAIQSGASTILETDDDNFPLANFWQPRPLTFTAALAPNHTWINSYRYFTDKHIWPRGFPLEEILASSHPVSSSTKKVTSPIQQGLVNQNPDVDAIYRFVLPLPFTFKNKQPLALEANSYCPFNSQNTVWLKSAFPLLYLPSFCTFRMTDIWRSFIAQRIMWEYGWQLTFHRPTLIQERNEHSLLKDFEQEVPGYLNNAKLRTVLDALTLKNEAGSLFDNLVTCYEALVKHEFFPKSELKLVKCWVKDVEKFSAGST